MGPLMVPSLEGLAPFQIAFIAGDLERAARAFERDTRRSRGSTRSAPPATAAYYDTAEALGFLVEAVEPPREMPPPDFTL